MPWLTEAEFRTLYITESATETPDALVSQGLRAGVRQVTKLVGAAAAAEVVAAETTANAGKRQDLREAQGKLAYREFLLVMSSRSRDGGIAETERDANGQTTNKYVSFADIEKRRAALYSDALEALGGYLELEDVGATSLTNRNYSSRVKVVADW